MEMLNHFLVSVVCYLGLLAGFIILSLAPEEKKPGMPYFRGINYFLGVFSVLLANYFLLGNIFVISLSVLFLVLIIYFKEKLIFLSYGYFGVMLFVLIDNIGYPAFAALIFAFGLSSGAFLYEKKSFLKLFYYIYFIAIANGLIWIL